MLNLTSSNFEHRLQDILLIVLSLITLPFDTSSVLVSYANFFAFHDGLPKSAANSPKRILVTGVGMCKGLSIARLFHQSGHTVIGADFSSIACGRVSTSILKYFTLPDPKPVEGRDYVEALITIITREKIDLWISCSGVASAILDGIAKEAIESRTSCKAIQFDVQTTQTLHEKDSFIQRTAEIGLKVPTTHNITSFADARSKLESSPVSDQYIMKTVGVNDSVRANMTLLSRASLKESLSHLSTLDISPESPWIMQQFIRGPEYCTHSVVIRGQIKCFVACPSAELLMHYQALPPDSALSQAMQRFTQTFAEKHGKSFTGHLSFDFMVLNAEASDPLGIKLYPIECNPRAHTAVALFRNTPAMVDCYLGIFDGDDDDSDSTNTRNSKLATRSAPTISGKGVSNGVPVSSKQTTAKSSSTAFPAHSTPRIVYPLSPPDIYWVPHDLITLFLIPLHHHLTSALTYILPPAPHSSLPNIHSSSPTLLASLTTFQTHVLHWCDGTFHSSDPLPYWWLAHVYWPAQFLWCLFASFGLLSANGRSWRWSRVNVSTCKVFEC